jgi:L-rhamnose isomerase/sugar isomerase
VLIDMGHHAFGVNVPQIVARLIGRGVPGGFHFNTRYAADDDHAVEHDRQMFAIFNELVSGGVIGSGDPEREWAYMIDQCSSLENRIQAVIHTVDSLMISYARALVVNRDRLKALQAERLVIQANREFLDAMLTDVRPIVALARMEQDLPIDPVAEYVATGYQTKINTQRAT